MDYGYIVVPFSSVGNRLHCLQATSLPVLWLSHSCYMFLMFFVLHFMSTG